MKKWQSHAIAAAILALAAGQTVFGQRERRRYHRVGADIPTSGQLPARHKELDTQIIEFVKETDIPGLIVRVTFRGNTVFSRGYGYSNVPRKKVMTDEMSSRIGSLSKSLTTTAILQLVQRKKVSLDDKILLALSNGKPPKVADARMLDMTLYQCLTHTTGMAESRSNPDHVTRPRYWAKRLRIRGRMTSAQMYRAVLLQKLAHPPGAKTVYNNTGYFLLGLLIEKLSGMKYEDYVRSHVLKPLGIEGVRVGGAKLSQMPAGEVRYYSSTPKKLPSATGKVDRMVSAPYAWDMDLVASAGGWVATPEEFLTFLNSFRDDSKRLLSEESMAAMFKWPPHLSDRIREAQDGAIFYRSCGWEVQNYGRTPSVKDLNFFHGGTLDFANTYAVSLRNGVSYVIFCNCREMPIRPKDAPSGDRYNPRPAKYLSERLVSRLAKMTAQK